MRSWALVCVWLGISALVGCASAPDEKVGDKKPDTVEPVKEAEVLTVKGGESATTQSGATLSVPEGFEALVRGNIVELKEPDGAVEVYVVELEGEDMAAAVLEAWKQIDPGFARKVDQAIDPPAQGVWDAIRVETDVKNAEGVFSQSVARRKGAMIWVSILRGQLASIDKRSAQARSFLGSLEVPGGDEVDLAEVEPTSISDKTDVLSAFIDEAMEKTGTPGLQIAVVEEGKVVFSKGYGVREVGKKGAVDPDTLMMIGSVSKSLTTLMMARLVDQGKLDWEAKAQEVYPGFKLGDPKLAASLKVEQLVCACAGLPRKDLPLILEFEGKGALDVFTLLSTLSPSTGLGETFQYQNQMVAAGGYIAAHAFDPKARSLDKTYIKAMNKLVFEPLGMKRTTLNHDAAIRDKNRAAPHSQDLQSAHIAVSLEHERFAATVAPSGAIWSSANDMARYIITELNKGVAPGGERIASEANHTRRWSKQVAIADGVHYGLGWVVSEKKGIKKINHGGGTMGFATLAIFYPDKGRGVVMISNGTAGHTIESLVDSMLFEMWFGAEEKVKDLLQFSLDTRKKALDDLSARMSDPDIAFMKPWLGTHHHPEMGDFVIKAKAGGGYTLDTGIYKTGLKRHDRPDGKAALIFTDPPLAGLELLPLTEGEGSFEMIRGQEKYIFEKK